MSRVKQRRCGLCGAKPPIGGYRYATPLRDPGTFNPMIACADIPSCQVATHERREQQAASMKPLRAIDLCCGAGGWAVAARGLPIKIVAAVDWWDLACATYKLNHPEVLVVRADGRHIPIRPEGFDLVLGGIPCQWLTILRSAMAGNAPSDEEIARERALLDGILAWTREANPPYWCLEDVKQIVGELPLFTPHQLIDAKRWSGQRRLRCYVGNFPMPEAPGSDLTAGAYLRPGPHRVAKANLKRKLSRRNSWQNEQCVYPIEADRKMPTVVTFASRHDNKHVVHDPATGRRRQIEWTEGALAQGFPEDYVFVGSQGHVSQMVANAVQIDTARGILETIVQDARAKVAKKASA